MERVFENLCQSSQAWSDSVLSGYAKGKTSGLIGAEKVRTIVPLPTVIKVIDKELAWSVNGVTDFLLSGVGGGFYEAAKKGSQVLDVVFGARLALERGLDARSGASVSQADILKFTIIWMFCV